MTDTEPTFSQLIDLLTVNTPTFIRRDVGMEMHDKQGLLAQLRGAIFGGMESGASSAGYGSRPPIDATAVDLLEEITTQATQALAAVSNLPTPYGHAETYVRLWAGQATDDQTFIVTAKATAASGKVFDERFQMTGYRLAKRWVDKVEGFFNPPSSAEICAPCPRCEQRYIYRVKDGVEIQSAAINMLRDRETGTSLEARCSNCGTVWQREELERLGALVGDNPALSVAPETIAL